MEGSIVDEEGMSLQIRGHNELAYSTSSVEEKPAMAKLEKKTLVFRARPLTMYIMLAQLHFQERRERESHNAYKKVPTCVRVVH